MKEVNFNIVIPSIAIDANLRFCLSKLNNLKYKKFFVTIVLDQLDMKLNLKLYNYKIYIISTKNKNMSAKRNFAVKKYKSTHIAFLDSDAYPNKYWLSNAKKYFIKYGTIVLGGPNIPFPYQKNNITHFSKRSFFLNGHLAYRKFRSKKKFINDWLESCNFFIPRDLYINCKGMDENIYIGEDQHFFKKLKKFKKDVKILFCPSLFIFHKERGYINFLLQRFSFGTDVFSGISFEDGLRGLAVSLPLILFLSTLIFFIFFNLDILLKIKFFSFFLLIVNILIFFEISRYVASFKKKILTLLSINILNLVYSFAGLMTIFGLKKFLQKKIYKNSK